jgi:predicted short-subunit dehydrogenase-like oxidoreductase (DUF2520 family)
MGRKPSFTIVGAGSLGTSLALALKQAGFGIEEIVFRSDQKRADKLARRTKSKAVRFSEAKFGGEVVWICVGDRDIAKTAGAIRERVNWKGKVVFHASGALASDELQALRNEGASVAAVHPMMSFVRSSETSFEDVSFALEGDGIAVRLAARISKALGGSSFVLKPKDKPLYHALGAFSSPLIVAQMAAAERIGLKLGLKPEQTRRVIGPILLKTVRNYLEHGAAAAFSGPIPRGDVQTVARNLAALKRVRGLDAIYRSLAEVAIEDLPNKQSKSLGKLIRRVRP